MAQMRGNPCTRDNFSPFKRYYKYGMRVSLMVSALVSASSGLGSSPGWTQYVVFLAIYSHSTTLRPGVEMSSGELNT